MSITIDAERLARITTLAHGSHQPPNGHIAACVMEAVAYVAGEPWSDRPECACPVIGAFLRSWNDALNGDERTKLLLPLVPRLVGTRGSKALEARRATMAADWYIRASTPAWLRLVGLSAHADTLASFSEITSFEETPSIHPALEAAQKDARAAESAGWSAALSAAEHAAKSAALNAALNAVEHAAESAAGSALHATTTSLQHSALGLLDRMIREHPQS